MTLVRTFLLSLLYMSLLALGSSGRAAASQSTTQSFTLVPGWNAIYLEVDPANRDPEVLFQGLPIRSVWTWRARLTSLEFVADATEQKLRETGWLGYFPPNRQEAFLSNLVEIQVNRPYLIKLGGSTPVNLQVTGRPSLRRARWQPDSYNLVGFGVLPSAPSFQDFFAGSPAHAGQPIYRLDAGGSWRLAAPGEAMRAGEAFFVFTAGASDYDGPIDVDLMVGDALDFGSVVERVELEITNRALTPKTLTVELIQESGHSSALSVLRREAPSISVNDWVAMPPSLSLPAAPGETVSLRLAADRQYVTGRYEALLRIGDGSSRRLLPASVEAPGAVATRGGVRTKGLGNPRQGLWIGSVRLDKVNEVHHATDQTTPTDTPAELEARLLLHVDSSGNVKLLKEVIQMWQDGTTTTDPESGLAVTATPGRFVLVTDKTQLAQYSGATIRGNKTVGRRISTAFVDWNEATSGTELAGTGDLSTAVSFSFTLPAEHPTNPFRHRYHPEHDESAESYAVGRTIALTFSGTDPEAGPSGPAPGWQTTRLAGTYAETLTGLHQRPLTVSGTFTLERFSTDGELNP